MAVTSNSPISWSTINITLIYSYYVVASSIVVMYDWAMISGQEFELVWSQRWSRITVLYLSVRSLAVFYCFINILGNIQPFPVTDRECTILWFMQKCTPAVVIFILGIVMIIRLHAMYQGSRKMLNFLVIAFLALMFITGVLVALGDRYYVQEVFVLSGTYYCLSLPPDGNVSILINSDLEYVTGLAWEVLALCLAVWIVIKHFCELQRQPRGWTIKDCFTVLIKTHVLYFAAFALTSPLKLGNMSHNMMNVSIVMYEGFIQIVTAVQLFVLGPRLILSVRAYHYQLLADSDEGTAMTTIAFQECSRESIRNDA